MTILGLPVEITRLSPYSPKWIILYEEEKELIYSCIENYIISIQHVGSTSIPGMIAKPIIDIAVGVASLLDGFKCITSLEKLGYKYRGFAGIEGRLFFAKGDVSNITHHVHVEEFGGTNWINHILFRDYLQNHIETRKGYSDIKVALAKEFEYDRNAYTANKDNFIKGVIEKAKKESHFL